MINTAAKEVIAKNEHMIAKIRNKNEYDFMNLNLYFGLS